MIEKIEKYDFGELTYYNELEHNEVAEAKLELVPIESNYFAIEHSHIEFKTWGHWAMDGRKYIWAGSHEICIFEKNLPKERLEIRPYCRNGVNAPDLEALIYSIKTDLGRIFSLMKECESIEELSRKFITANPSYHLSLISNSSLELCIFAIDTEDSQRRHYVLESAPPEHKKYCAMYLYCYYGIIDKHSLLIGKEETEKFIKHHCKAVRYLDKYSYTEELGCIAIKQNPRVIKCLDVERTPRIMELARTRYAEEIKILSQELVELNSYFEDEKQEQYSNDCYAVR